MALLYSTAPRIVRPYIKLYMCISPKNGSRERFSFCPKQQKQITCHFFGALYPLSGHSEGKHPLVSANFGADPLHLLRVPDPCRQSSLRTDPLGGRVCFALVPRFFGYIGKPKRNVISTTSGTTSAMLSLVRSLTWLCDHVFFFFWGGGGGVALNKTQSGALQGVGTGLGPVSIS